MITSSRQSRLSVLMHSSNHYPLGNCDSPEPETNPGYLTQSGAVSHRSSLPGSFFAFTDGARTPPEELVNPASSVVCISTDFTGVVSTSLTQPFPGRPGVSLRLPRQICTHRQPSQIFSGVWNHQVAQPKLDLITSRLRGLLFVPLGSWQSSLRA
jgi:hypothetical protein